jgi:hypothetical protein
MTLMQGTAGFQSSALPALWVNWEQLASFSA